MKKDQCPCTQCVQQAHGERNPRKTCDYVKLVGSLFSASPRGPAPSDSYWSSCKHRQKGEKSRYDACRTGDSVQVRFLSIRPDVKRVVGPTALLWQRYRVCKVEDLEGLRWRRSWSLICLDTSAAPLPKIRDSRTR